MKKKCRECEDYGDIVVFSVLSDCLELTVTRDQQLHIEPGHEISQRQSVHIEPQLTWSDEMTHHHHHHSPVITRHTVTLIGQIRPVETTALYFQFVRAKNNVYYQDNSQTESYNIPSYR